MAVKIDKGYIRKADGTLLQLAAGHLVTAGGAIRVFPQTVDISAAVITLGAALTYNGSTQTKKVASVVLEGVTLTEGVDYTVSGNTGTNAGSYTLTVTGIGDYEGAATAAWSIAKATGKISVSPTSLSILGVAGTTKTATITYTGDGAITVASNKTSVATVSRSGSTVTVKSVAAGSATITITLAAGTNYKGASCKISVSVDTALFKYTGAYATSSVTIDGAGYTLYTLTESGTLTTAAEAKYWMCGGGGDGGGNSTYGSGGNGGDGGAIQSGSLAVGSYAIVVGAANGDTQVGSLTAKGGTNGTYGMPAYGGDAGTGGDAYPFGLTSLYLHSPGGGGAGGYRYNSNADDYVVYKAVGGDGGSDGSAGGYNYLEHSSSANVAGGAGGTRGGGNGGNVSGSGASGATCYAGAAGTFYGAGGGGGAAYYSNYESQLHDPYVYSEAGGSGYQGVVYIAIPA